jgi:hypothetical protein
MIREALISKHFVKKPFLNKEVAFWFLSGNTNVGKMLFTEHCNKPLLSELTDLPLFGH